MRLRRRIQTVVSSSCNTWSYSLRATQKMIAVTSSKQCIHFLRSDRWPPTSNNLFTRQDTDITNVWTEQTCKISSHVHDVLKHTLLTCRTFQHIWKFTPTTMSSLPRLFEAVIVGNVMKTHLQILLPYWSRNFTVNKGTQISPHVRSITSRISIHIGFKLSTVKCVRSAGCSYGVEEYPRSQ